MQHEQCAIVAPAAKVMLVAMLIAFARSEHGEESGSQADGPASEPLLRRLANLTLSELERLAETGALRIVVSCDRNEIAWSLRASARRRAEQALLEYFIRHGAPRALLRSLFSASRARIDAVRRRLRIPSAPGRPKLPRPREREAIVAAWVKLGPGADRRSRYHALHRAFPRYTIATLDQVLREAPGEVPAARRAGNRPRAEPVSLGAPRPQAAPARVPGAVVHRRVPR